MLNARVTNNMAYSQLAGVVAVPCGVFFDYNIDMLSKIVIFKLPQALTALAVALLTIGTCISTQVQSKAVHPGLPDSISAAYGMDFSEGWAQQLGAELDAITLVNASVSGETTGGGLTPAKSAFEVIITLT